LFVDPEHELGEIFERVAQRSVRLVMQTGSEVEVTEFLGRDRSTRGDQQRCLSRRVA